MKFSGSLFYGTLGGEQERFYDAALGVEQERVILLLHTEKAFAI